MKKIINNTHIEGWLYEHKLEKRVGGEKSKHPGLEFINGYISIATDNAMTNVIQIHFPYVTALTSKGKSDSRWSVLVSIIDGKTPNVIDHGKENAAMLRVDSAIGLNDWFDSRNDNRLVSQKRNEGGFIRQVSELNEDENKRATFDVDIVLTQATRIEADIERNTPEYMRLRGATFNFRGDMLPIDLSVRNLNAMNYFESMAIGSNNPMFTNLRGIQIARTIVNRVEETGAWGEVSVTETRSSERDFVVNWAKPAPYDWDDESTITAAELDEAMKKREITLAEARKAHDDYQMTKGNAFSGPSGVSANAIPASGSGKAYDF